jgi:osmotically-inducible protein OsmY
MKSVKRFLAASLLVLTPLLQGCIEMAAVGAGAAVLSYEDRRSTSVQIEDEGIELRGSNRILERFGDKVHFNITSYNRSVLLTGEVPDEKTKEDIGKIASGVPGVRGVTNELRVAAIAPYSSRANDTAITGKVKARFLDAGRFSPVHVKVVTESGVVYLLGIVTEKEAEAAAEVARTTGGVRKVVKVFDYCQANESPCRPRQSSKGAETKDKPGG